MTRYILNLSKQGWIFKPAKNIIHKWYYIINSWIEFFVPLFTQNSRTKLKIYESGYIHTLLHRHENLRTCLIRKVWYLYSVYPLRWLMSTNTRKKPRSKVNLLYIILVSRCCSRWNRNSIFWLFCCRAWQNSSLNIKLRTIGTEHDWKETLTQLCGLACIIYKTFYIYTPFMVHIFLLFNFITSLHY